MIIKTKNLSFSSNGLQILAVKSPPLIGGDERI